MSSLPDEELVIPLRGIRRTIARRMMEAWEAPVFHLTVSVEAAPVNARRKATNGATFTDEVIRCVGIALREHPRVNALFSDDAIHIQPTANVGLAVALDDGLIVPVIHGVDHFDLGEITAARTRLVELARGGQLEPGDVAGGTFTVSNLGMFGVERFDAILNCPQVGILAVGTIQERLILCDNQISVSEVVELTLTADHRALTGSEAGNFMRSLKLAMEAGTQLDVSRESGS